MMAYPNNTLAHCRKGAQGGGAVVSSRDSPLYRLVAGNQHMSVAGQPTRLNHPPPGFECAVTRQMLSPPQSIALTSARHVSHMTAANNGCYVMPKPHKDVPHSDRTGMAAQTESSIRQVEKLMSLLLFKDGQISALNSRVEAMHSSIQNYEMKEEKSTGQKKAFQADCEAKDREIRQLSQDLATVKLSKKKVASDRGKLQNLLDSKAVEFSEMKHKVETLQIENKSLTKTNVEIWDERRELMQKLEDIEVKYRINSETLERTSQNLHQVKTLKQKMELEKKRLEMEKRKLEKCKEDAFQTVQVLKSVIQQKENRIDQLQGKMKELSKQNKKKTETPIICNCPGKEENLATAKKLKEKEESEARLGDMLAKMKNQISFLGKEKEKARQQMIQAWESETNLRSQLARGESARTDLEKELCKLKKANAKQAVAESGYKAEKVKHQEKHGSKNAELKKRIKELELKLLESDSQCLDSQPVGEEKEDRCKVLYKELIRYRVSPTNCKDVAQCVLKHLLNKSMNLPGKEFAWTAQRKNPPTPHVSDEEESGEADDIDEDECTVINDNEDDDNIQELSPEREVPNSDEKRKLELTKKLDQCGGLWCSAEEMDDKLSALDKKQGEEAVIVQLQYQSVVLELARESKLLFSSLTGKQKPFVELKASLLKLIRQNEANSLECKKEWRRNDKSRSDTITEERKRMYSPGPDYPILRPRKKRMPSRKTLRSVPFESLLGKAIEHYMYDSDGDRDWQRGVVIEQARNKLTILYEFAKDSPMKVSMKDARDDFEKGDLVVCEVTQDDFLGKEIENLWEMDEGITEWWKGRVVKMGVDKGEDTEYEVAYKEENNGEFIYFVPIFKDYWSNEVRFVSL